MALYVTTMVIKKKTLTTVLRLIKPSISAHHWCVVLVLFYLNRKVRD